MRLKPGFHFSQNNLQDFVDCPRRFELLHVLHLPWPAIQSEPVLEPVSYTHLRAHETVLDIVCRLLLEKKKLTMKTC